MSNENPFAAPDSAPLQAPPVTQPAAAMPATAQAAPVAPAAPGQYAAPQAGYPAPGQYPAPQAGYPAQAWPVGYAAGVPTAPPLRAGRGLPIAMIALSAVYALVCLIEIIALSHRVSLANQLINDPTSVTIDQADSADNTVNALSLIAIIVFLAGIVVLIVWQRSLRRMFSYPGHYQALLKESGYLLFRIVWIISIFLAVFLRGNGTFDSPQQVITHDHEYMAYFGVRAALGLLLIFLSVRLMRAVQRTVALAQSGYSPRAVNPLQP